MKDCIFCKIVEGTIPSNRVYEDEHVIAFHDLEPQAPVHVLLIPRKHIASLDHIQPDDAEVLGHLLSTVKVVAEELGLENGYRIVVNTGEDGMQTVPHLHIHILGKRRMGWPPG